jgi:hypothetical protein
MVTGTTWTLGHIPWRGSQDGATPVFLYLPRASEIVPKHRRGCFVCSSVSTPHARGSSGSQLDLQILRLRQKWGDSRERGLSKPPTPLPDQDAGPSRAEEPELCAPSRSRPVTFSLRERKSVFQNQDLGDTVNILGKS